MENISSEGRDPSAFLSEIIGAPVTVKLNSGVVYKGELQSVDGYMNIALEQSKEFMDGKLRRSYGDAFIRGNNGLYHSLLYICPFSCSFLTHGLSVVYRSIECSCSSAF
ncbi:U4/U6-U5 snRNP complex subunit LSM6 [Aspergillus clavatus NRRL 1]|uniref:U4/U6-U5 snRNP complex subunit LSM6 n=1 Tax=Aspergillus clavatus (strain ATCC 1007 / CBS 513.65 / DSM 816 / NCTC 3887 / NRRL 1 / QM 1276 / 107) TaxID=344612 RepID=UPI0000EA498C|nr:LSM domain protein [Aspergillus clavatus NRRL 1]EAW11118.1 LSM domain protein [Aspergillus clavatus NRRL 1]